MPKLDRNKKWILYGLLVILSMLLIPSLLMAASVSELSPEIERIIQICKIPRDSFGLIVQDLKSGKILYSNHAQQKFIPASNIKLISSAASLYILGPHYSFKTLALSDTPLRDGILDGNLYIKGFGDPFLVSEELWLLAKEVKNYGIRQINGNIIGDESYFDSERVGPNWPDGGEGLEPYKPQISALSLNFNTVTFYFRPGYKVGSLINVSVDPEGEYIKLSNQATTNNNNSNGGIYLDRQFKDNADYFSLKGSLPINSGSQRVYRNISQPVLYTTSAFLDFLKKEGISIKGGVALGKAPPSAKEVAAHFSKPLAQVISDMNKFSNNFMAEQVVKAIGAEVEGPPGTWEKGLRAIKDFLKQTGIGEGEYTLVDGSGLSRMNRLTPEHFLKVLNFMNRDFKLQPEYLSSLAITGVDGTLRKKMKGTSGVGRIRAKTGTLDGVKSLSGYAEGRDGKTLAFSLLINFSGSAPGDIAGFVNRLQEVLINH